jgi:hypothetical protein
MQKEETKLMYSGKDIDIIKKVFADNDDLLIVVRKLFFGLDLTDAEKESIKGTFKDKDIRDVLQRKVYGLNDFTTPVGQLSDFWLGVETQVFGAGRDAIQQAVESKQIVFGMFEKAMALLENPDAEKVNINVAQLPDLMTDPLQVHLIARNLYMKAVETSLLTMKSIAGMKQETTEEAIKRLTKDSSK